MKKIVMALTVAAMLTASVIGVSATAAEYTPTDGKYTVTYNVGSANAGKYYGVVVMKNINSKVDFSNTENILYIDQVTADADGNITVADFATKGVAPGEDGFSEGTVYIGGTGYGTAQLIGYTKNIKEEKPETKTYTITGKVTDEKTKKEATVTLYNAEDAVVTTKTTVEGAYSLTNVAEGAGYKIVIKKASYAPYTITNITISADAGYDADVSTLVGDVDDNRSIGSNDLALVTSIDNYNTSVETEDDAKLDVDSNTKIGSNDVALILGTYNNLAITVNALAQ